MMKGTFTRRMAALFMACLFGTLAGCATMEGMGADGAQGSKAVKKEPRDFPSAY